MRSDSNSDWDEESATLVAASPEGEAKRARELFVPFKFQAHGDLLCMAGVALVVMLTISSPERWWLRYAWNLVERFAIEPFSDFSAK